MLIAIALFWFVIIKKNLILRSSEDFSWPWLACTGFYLQYLHTLLFF